MDFTARNHAYNDVFMAETSDLHMAQSIAISTYASLMAARVEADPNPTASPWYAHIKFDLHNDPHWQGNGCKTFFR